MQTKNLKIYSANDGITLIDQKGFTLIELMVVIVILSVLAVWVAPKIMGRPDQAKQVKARVDIQGYETALKLYKLDNGAYPTTEQGLDALVTKPGTGKLAKNWRTGGYIDKGKIAKDSWGNEFIYLSPGVNGDFDITSYGADGEPGGEEYAQDINNWEIE
jgi:general secretion pathway protein G